MDVFIGSIAVNCDFIFLGGFVAKGVGQILDPKQINLFNITKEGQGIKHWLKDVSLKSQKEIIAQGGNIKKNLKNLNIAQISGIAYSAIMLGVLLPKLNIWMTKHNKKLSLNPFKQLKTPDKTKSIKENNKNFSEQKIGFKSNLKNKYISIDEFQQLVHSKQKSYNF